MNFKTVLLMQIMKESKVRRSSDSPRPQSKVSSAELLNRARPLVMKTPFKNNSVAQEVIMKC